MKELISPKLKDGLENENPTPRDRAQLLGKSYSGGLDDLPEQISVHPSTKLHQLPKPRKFNDDVKSTIEEDLQALYEPGEHETAENIRKQT